MENPFVYYARHRQPTPLPTTSRINSKTYHQNLTPTRCIQPPQHAESLCVTLCTHISLLYIYIHIYIPLTCAILPRLRHSCLLPAFASFYTFIIHTCIFIRMYAFIYINVCTWQRRYIYTCLSELGCWCCWRNNKQVVSIHSSTSLRGATIL